VVASGDRIAGGGEESPARLLEVDITLENQQLEL